MSYRGGRGRGRGASRGSAERGGVGVRGGRGDSRGGRGDSRGGRGDLRGGRGGPREQGGVLFFGSVPSTLDAQVADNSQDDLINPLKALTINPTDLPLRPDFGTVGQPFQMRTNFFPVQLPRKTIFEYLVAIAPETAIRRIKRRIFELAEETYDWTHHGLNGKVAHDFSSKLVAVNRLPDPLVIRVLFWDDDLEPEEYTLTFRFVKGLDASNLLDLLAGEDRAYEVPSIISALNLILAAFPRSPAGQGVNVGRNRYFFPSGGVRPVSLDGGLIARKGFYSSVRPAWKQLMVNVNACTTAFYQSQNLAVAMNQFRNHSFGAQITTFARGVRVKTIHLGHKKTVRRIHRATARQHQFDSGEFGMVSVQEYFKKKYNITLAYPDLQLVDVGGQNFIPPEVCDILPDQPYRCTLTDEQTTEMTRVAAMPPNINAGLIKDEGLRSLGFRQNAGPLNAFEISIGQEMVVVPGRLLPAPVVNYGQGIPNVDEKASWNLKPVKFVVGGRLAQWAVLLIHDPAPQGIDDRLKRSVKGLADMCRTSGMRVEGDPIYAVARIPPRDHTDPIRDAAIKAIRHTITTEYPVKPSMILVILANGDKHVYNGLKHLLDVCLNVHSVCVQASKFMEEKGQLQYFANVALKINMKMGGVNHRLVDPPGAAPTLAWLKDPSQPTMLVGMDVSDPAPGSVRGTPSIAAVVATIDDNFAQFPASLKMQETRKEMITDLKVMMTERLKLYQKHKKVLPRRIVVYRKGVSEGQFKTVIEHELPNIVESFKDFENAKQPYRPKLTIIVCTCGKRHHTRFFPIDAQFADINGNPRPGTVVDKGVTAVYEFDFFLQAHYGLQGTVRPTHYYVIHDEIGFDANRLQNLTHAVSYMSARATKAVSRAAPAYFADLACKRGRAYLHKLFQGISEVGATTASGTINEGEEQLTTLREAERLWLGGPGEGLKDTMFYL